MFKAAVAVATINETPAVGVDHVGTKAATSTAAVAVATINETPAVGFDHVGTKAAVAVATINETPAAAIMATDAAAKPPVVGAAAEVRTLSPSRSRSAMPPRRTSSGIS